MDDCRCNKYDYFLFLLITSLAFGGLGGAITVSRALAIILCPSLFCLLSSQRVKIFHPIIILLVGWYVYALFSILWTSNIDEALKESLYYFVHFLLFVEILVFSRFANRTLSIVPFAWMTGFLLTSIVGIWEIVTDNHLAISKTQTGAEFRLNGVVYNHFFASVTFDNYNNYVTYICYCFPFFLYLFSGPNVIRKICALFAICLSFVFVFLNASRGGGFTLVGMFFVYFLIQKKFSLKNLLALFIVGIVLFATFFQLHLFDLFFARLSYTSSTENSRIDLWYNALEMLYSTIFIGSGLGGLQTSMSDFSLNGLLMTHNLFLEILVQFGFVVFIPIFLFFIRFYIDSFFISKSPLRNIAIISLLFFPIYSIINSGYLLFPQTYVFFSSLVVVVYHEFSKSIR